jgi:hypothetical protein
MRKITQFQISELIGKFYGRAVSLANAVTGFARTGIWSVYPNVFQDSDFATSIQESYPSAGNTNSVTECQAATSSNTRQEKTGLKPKSTTPYRKVEEISPLPKSNGVRTRKTTAATVLTSSPHKVQLENKVSCGTKNRKLAFSESVAERRPSWFCKLCKLDEMRDIIQRTGCREWVHQDCAKVGPKKYHCEECI